jgi:predicted membrane protein
MEFVILNITLAAILVYSVVDKIVRDKKEEKRREKLEKKKKVSND